MTCHDAARFAPITTAPTASAALRALAQEFSALASALDAARDAGLPDAHLGAVKALTDSLYGVVLPRLLDAESWAKQVAPVLQARIHAAGPAPTTTVVAPAPVPAATPTSPSLRRPRPPSPSGFPPSRGSR